MSTLFYVWYKTKGWGKEKIAYGFKQERIEDLTFEQIRLVKELKPKVVICENVKGLTMSYALDYLNMMIKGGVDPDEMYLRDLKLMDILQSSKF